VLCLCALLRAGGAGSAAWANEFVNDAEGAAYADWEDLYAKNSAVSCPAACLHKRTREAVFGVCGVCMHCAW
jgi:hypothetical protein